MEGGGGLQATDDLRQQRHARSRSRRTLRHSLGREDGPDDCQNLERAFDDDSSSSSSSRLTQYEPATEATTLSCLASGQPTCSSGCWLRRSRTTTRTTCLKQRSATAAGRSSGSRA